MAKDRFRIGVAAPGSRLEPMVAAQVRELVADAYPNAEIHFHPQCFLASGHFAGDDLARAQGFLEIANDESFDALWVARGGYGACRIAERVVAGLKAGAKEKIYLGYSDAGSLFAGLYPAGFNCAHGPVAADIRREGGEVAVKRALAWMIDRDKRTLEPTVSSHTPAAAFNLTILCNTLGTPLEPDLSGHVLMLEEVSEHMYRIDRSFCHLTSNPAIRRVAGIRLGRCSEIPPNDPDFGQTEVQVVKHWCDVSGIPYLGRADIGHDVENKVVPFGRLGD
jgi:muramoyltetrapeptide carboxypeptidase